MRTGVKLSLKNMIILLLFLFFSASMQGCQMISRNETPPSNPPLIGVEAGKCYNQPVEIYQVTQNGVVCTALLDNQAYSWGHPVNGIGTHTITVNAFSLLSGLTNVSSCTFTIQYIQSWVAKKAMELGPNLVTFKNKLWLMAINPGYLNSMSYSNDGLSWSPPQSMPWQGREAMSLFEFDNKLWMMGGLSADRTCLNDIWNSEDGLVWNLVTANAAWSPRFDVKVALVKEKIFLIAGKEYPNSPLPEVWCSVDGVHWDQVYDGVELRRMAFACTVYHNRIYIAGGWLWNSQVSGYDIKNDVWCSEDGSHWVCLSAGTEWLPRLYSSLVVFGDQLTLLGGRNINMNQTNEVWFSPDGVSWTQNVITNNTQFTPTDGLGSVVFNNSIWLAGGVNNPFLWASE